MSLSFNNEKIKSFYDSVVNYYPSYIKENNWGTAEEVTKAIMEESYVEDEEIIVKLKNGQLSFPITLFEFLFAGVESNVFNNEIGSRFNYSGFTYIELKESPVIRIESEDKIHAGLYKITENDSDNLTNCLFVYDESDISYPSEIIPFFVAQLLPRLNKSLINFQGNFLLHFEPIKYVIRIKQDQNTLLIKLFYKLAAELGLIENKIDERNKISIKSKNISLANILFDITNENSQNLLPLYCFISAASNTNPYYRFLDIYHIFESLFYKHFYSYVKNLPETDVSKKTYREIKEHMTDEQMLKLVLINSLLDDEPLRVKVKSELLNCNAEEPLERLGQTLNISEWNTKNNDEFAKKLASIIYKLRNSIAHSGETEKHIERINDDPDLTENFINITNVIMDISKKTIYKNIYAW